MVELTQKQGECQILRHSCPRLTPTTCHNWHSLMRLECTHCMYTYKFSSKPSHHRLFWGCPIKHRHLALESIKFNLQSTPATTSSTVWTFTTNMHLQLKVHPQRIFPPATNRSTARGHGLYITGRILLAASPGGRAFKSVRETESECERAMEQWRILTRNKLPTLEGKGKKLNRTFVDCFFCCSWRS